jgi:hypothetical protein
VRLRGFGGTVRGEYTDAGDDLRRWAGAVQLAIGMVRLETEWQRYLEYLPDGRTDSLTLGTVGGLIGLPVVRNHLTVLVGAGLSTYHDPYGDESGWYAKAGFEAFPLRPLILSGELWAGYIRADEFDTETALGGGRATLGAVWNRFEVYGGWQATWIGSVTLDGPTGGVRVWF